MDNFYNIEILDDSFIDMSTSASRTLCYRMTYKDLKSNRYDKEINNPFVVYILHAKNYSGKDILYIGKSKNGIKERPKQHEDKNIEWDMCYVLTQFKERTILNDGTIQYLEDILTEKAKETNCYDVKTQQTSKGTANRTDVRNCQAFVEDALEMLYILGLDLKTIRNIEDIKVEINKTENKVELFNKYTRPVWGLHGEDQDIFLKQNQLAIGWEHMGDLTNLPEDKEICKNKYSKIYPDAKAGSVASSVAMLYKFRYDMKKDDIAVFSYSDTVHIGIITGDYFYVENERFPNRRNVKWIKHIPRNNLSQEAQYSLRAGLTLFELKRSTNEFLSLINISNQNDNKKEILINQLFTGKYNNMGDNIGHEIINIFKDDSNTYNLFITPSGKVENHNIDTILFVKNEDKPYVVEVVGMATNLQIFNADNDPLITYNGKTEKEIFYGNQYKGTIETNDESPVMYRTDDIKMPVNRLYLGVKDLVNDDNIILIDNNEKKLTNTSMRSYHKEGSDIYKQLEEIINSTDWKPLDTDEIYKRCSNNKIFEQSYTRFMNKIK